MTGLEPAPEEWGTSVLPLHHTGVLPWKALSMAGLLYHFPNGVAPFEVVRSLGVWGLSHGCDGSGIPPAAAPSFRGANPRIKEVWVSRIEPSGQGISPEPCTTHGFGFGVGGTGRNRTGDLCVRLYSDSTTELLSHITAGYGSTTAGGLFLLSA